MLAFGDASLRDHPGPLTELGAAYGSSHVVGCSTAGQILGPTLSDGGVVVAVARFDASTVSSACAPIASADDSFRAGRDLAKSLLTDDLRAVFVMSDGLGVNGSELAHGVASEVPPGVVVTGGLAGDDDRFGSTWVLVDGAPAAGFVSAVGIAGPRVRVGHGSQGGWDQFGPERVVTRSSANVLFELDGRPALEIYRSYLGELAEGLPATALLFPLALREDRDAVEQLVRTVLAVDEAEQSMTFAGDVPEGALAQLMHTNFERLVGGACRRGGCRGRHDDRSRRRDVGDRGELRRAPAGVGRTHRRRVGSGLLPVAGGQHADRLLLLRRAVADRHRTLRVTQPDDDPHDDLRGVGGGCLGDPVALPDAASLHAVLPRQLRRIGIDAEYGADAPQLAALLERVAAAYEAADQDRYRLERSLEMSSQEDGRPLRGARAVVGDRARTPA